MKLSRDDWLILLVGGPLFGVLAHWKFAESPGLVVSIAVGLAVMAMIVGLRRLIGEHSWPRFLVVAFAAGAITGSVLWWLIDGRTPWFYYALPGGLFYLIAGSLDRLIEGRKRKSDHGEDPGS